MRLTKLAILFMFALSYNLVYGQFTSQKEPYVPNNHNTGMYLRIQPLYIISHNTYFLEIEYFLATNHSLSAEFYYSTKVSEGDDICLGCYLTDNADSRLLLDIQYKYYLPWFDVFISPYFRVRNWQGELDEYVEEIVTDQSQYTLVTSTGIAIGGTIGARFVDKGRFDGILFMGLGGYVYESYQPESPYTIEDNLEIDIRFGLSIGFRLFK